MAFPHINTKATHIELTPDIEDRLEKKLHTLEKFIPSTTDCVCDVELEKLAEHQTGKVYRAEVNLQVAGKLFRAEATDETIEAAIDQAKNELKRELRRSSGKHKSLIKKGGQKLKDMLRFGR